MENQRLWLFCTIFTVGGFGLWGALINSTAEAGFPETLGYCVWALTMIPPSLIALRLANWQLEYNIPALLLGCAAGFLGAGGQLILFKTLRTAPAHLVFPFIALSPVLTILMALIITRERATIKGWLGIILALVAGVFLSYSEGGSGGIGFWVFLALLVFLAWGIQGFVISYANRRMRAESIFFYMMLTSLLLSPFAIWITDFRQEINWGIRGPYLAAAIQVLNSVGALFLVYAYRYGKAIIISPLINAGAPVVTILISLLLHWTLPHPIHSVGIVFAIIAAILMALEEESKEAG